MSRPFRIACLIPILSLVLSCSDDSVEPGSGSGSRNVTLRGHVTHIISNEPVAGARVALVEAIPYRLIAGPVVTDADGHYNLNHVPPGDWYILVYSDNMLMFDAEDAQVSISRLPSTVHDIELMDDELNFGPRRVHGTVTDAETGKPIAGAVVSGVIGMVFHDFVGLSVGLEDITDAEGHYTIKPPVLSTGQGGVSFTPVGVSMEGYAPFYMLDVPVDSVYVLDVALERPGTTGHIQGRVVDGAGPLAGVPVAVDYEDIPLDTLTGQTRFGVGRDAPDVPLRGSGVRTDADGRFEISGLSPGTYFVDAAFLPDDGYATTYDEAGIVEIQGDETVDVGDVYVIPAFAPLSPKNGEVVKSSEVTLSWEAVPTAVFYRLIAGDGHLLDFQQDVLGTSYTFDESIPDGTHMRWLVRAYQLNDVLIAAFESIPTFVVGE